VKTFSTFINAVVKVLHVIFTPVRIAATACQKANARRRAAMDRFYAASSRVLEPKVDAVLRIPYFTALFAVAFVAGLCALMASIDIPFWLPLVPCAVIALVVLLAAYADGWMNVHVTHKLVKTQPNAGRIKGVVSYRWAVTATLSRGEFLPKAGKFQG
jgi:hypothetical protein